MAVGVLALALGLPAGASGAPVPDRVVAEVSEPLGVGISGPVLAYSRGVGTGGVQIVVHDGDAPAKRLSAGRGTGPVDVGRDRRGRPVVGYERCGGRCDLVAFSPSARRSRVVVEGVRALDVTIGRGRIYWADGRTVSSRSLDGGPVRREAVARGVSAVEIDTDGRTLAVVGDGPSDIGNGSSALRSRVGLRAGAAARGAGERRGVRGLRAGAAARGYGEEYAELRGPVVTRSGVTTLFDEVSAGVAYAFADFRAGGRGLQERTSGGMGIVEWDADDRAMALVEAPSEGGCTVGDIEDDDVAFEAPCRIVLARSGGERLLPPRISISRRMATVLQTTLRAGTVTGRRPLAGVAVQFRRGGEVRARLVTDAQGRVMLPTTEGEGLAVVAETTPRSYAYLGA